MAWKDIKTAPRDYEFLAFWPDEYGNDSWNVQRTWYRQDRNAWESPSESADIGSHHAPTHWWDFGDGPTMPKPPGKP